MFSLVTYEDDFQKFVYVINPAFQWSSFCMTDCSPEID